MWRPGQWALTHRVLQTKHHTVKLLHLSFLVRAKRGRGVGTHRNTHSRAHTVLLLFALLFLPVRISSWRWQQAVDQLSLRTDGPNLGSNLSPRRAHDRQHCAQLCACLMQSQEQTVRWLGPVHESSVVEASICMCCACGVEIVIFTVHGSWWVFFSYKDITFFKGVIAV